MKNPLNASVPLLAAVFATALFAQSSTGPSLRILLPERTRLLQGQLVDLVLEVHGAKSVASVRVNAGANDISAKFAAPAAAPLDCDGSSGYTVRANLQSPLTSGSNVRIARPSG